MSLDTLLNQGPTGKKDTVTVKDVELYFPAEYDIDLDHWRHLIAIYNRTNRQTKTADAIQQYIREKNPGQPTNDLFTIGEIVERNGRFVADASFKKNKPALTAWYILKAENLKLVPISSQKGEDGIKHVVLSYTPS